MVFLMKGGFEIITLSIVLRNTRAYDGMQGMANGERRRGIKKINFVEERHLHWLIVVEV